eukprot:232024-Pelagomonas_calceolata.AAC.2
MRNMDAGTCSSAHVRGRWPGMRRRAHVSGKCVNKQGTWTVACRCRSESSTTVRARAHTHTHTHRHTHTHTCTHLAFDDHWIEASRGNLSQRPLQFGSVADHVRGVRCKVGFVHLLVRQPRTCVLRIGGCVSAAMNEYVYHGPEGVAQKRENVEIILAGREKTEAEKGISFHQFRKRRHVGYSTSAPLL